MEIDLPFGPSEVPKIFQIVEGFEMWSTSVMEGETLTKTITRLRYENESSRNIFKLVKAFEAEASSKGATRIVIKGELVLEDKFFNPAMAARLGYSYKKISDTAFELIKSLK